MRESYKTKTKEIIDNEIKLFKNGFTIKELIDSLNNKNIKIGKATVYRHLNDLVLDNTVKKYFDENNESHYKYLLDCESESHFYLKCNKCNKIVHIDCECINDFYFHIINKHKFYIESTNLIIPGICNECKNFIKL